ncbi:hypothetical protein EG835_00160 [bacterium]|nr:hypothetical protein [bacterium]
MVSLQPLLEEARSHYTCAPDLHHVVLNAASWVEANLAVELLADSVPEKALVTIANIREAIKELPRCPITMAGDFESLAQAWRLEPDGSGWSRTFEDGDTGYTIMLLGDGNYCYDIMIRTGGRTLALMPKDSEDFLNPDIIELIIECPSVLGNVIALIQAMGLVFYPTFYLSIEDWRQEHAQAVFEEVLELFGQERHAIEPPKRRARARKKVPVAH